LSAGIAFRPGLLFPGFNALRFAGLSNPFDYFRDDSEAERVKNSRLSDLFFVLSPLRSALCFLSGGQKQRVAIGRAIV